MPSARQPTHERSPGSQDEIVDLIGRIHEAPLQPDRWPQVLARIGDALGGATVLLEAGYRRPCGTFVATTSLAHPDHLDFFHRRCLGRSDAQAFYRDLRALPVGVPLAREPVPRDAGGGRKAVHQIVATCLLKDEGFAALIHLAREAGAADRRGLDPLRRLIPHLQQAIEVQRRLSLLEAERNATADVLDRLQLGVILVDAAGRVLSLNRRATEIVAARDGLSIGGGRLEAATPTDTSALLRLIDQAARLGAGHGLFAGSARVLPRPSARQPLAALVAPLRREVAAFGARRPAAAVFLTDPERENGAPEQVLQAVYGFTRTETALVLALVRGESLARTAARLRFGLNTAKTHLRHIFEKTGTHNRTELVRLILRGPARLRFDPLRFGSVVPPPRPATDKGGPG